MDVAATLSVMTRVEILDRRMLVNWLVTTILAVTCKFSVVFAMLLIAWTC